MSDLLVLIRRLWLSGMGGGQSQRIINISEVVVVADEDIAVARVVLVHLERLELLLYFWRTIHSVLVLGHSKHFIYF